MQQLKELLIDEMGDLMNAEKQLVEALPAVAEAAHAPKLKEAIHKHLQQTRGHVERLNSAFDLLGEKPQAKNCKAMAGILAEGKERIQQLREKDPLAADLGLITAAQKVEHYEISAYGTLRHLARQIGELEVATLLSQNLGEEESADFLLTEAAKPLLHQAAAGESAGHRQPSRARAQKA